MSVCLESNSVLASEVSTSGTVVVTSSTNTVAIESSNVVGLQQQQVVDSVASTSSQPQSTAIKAITKIPVATNNSTIQKTSLITVLNAPLGNVKTLCVTPAPNTTPGQFTVVNSTQLNLNNTNVKPQTITLINTPVTVVKAISSAAQQQQNSDIKSCANEQSQQQTLIENRGHNVFVKNTSVSNASNVTTIGGGGTNNTVAATATTDDFNIVPQSHTLLTANNFPINNILEAKTANGQRSKVKIVNNILIPNSNNSGNILLNKTSNRYLTQLAQQQQQQQQQQQLMHHQRQKNNNANGTKYISKQQLINKTLPIKTMDKTTQRIVYPTHKSQIKTIPPMNNFIQQQQHGIKTIPPRPAAAAAAAAAATNQIQRGIRTIPPQHRQQQKLPNKPNYIGKHAVQAQKFKQCNKLKSIKQQQIYNYPLIQQQQQQQQQQPLQSDKQLTFNQALTAEILETLSNNNHINKTTNSLPSYEIPSRYENSYYSQQQENNLKTSFHTDDNKSGLDALSLICQAVLLDHNYNATLPESPTRQQILPPSPAIPQVQQSQTNGGNSGGGIYLPGGSSNNIKRIRTLSQSNQQIPSIMPTQLLPVSVVMQGMDDCASDISDGSERKHDTEGEETDTAPEAEAVNNEDQFGDYVTRCICGFLHDDGYMVECDRCKVWQHVQCVVKNKQIPDEYLCEICDPLKYIDRHKARLIQQQWLRDRQFLDPKLKKDLNLASASAICAKIKDSVFKQQQQQQQQHKNSDSDSSDNEQNLINNNNNNNSVMKGRSNLINRRKNDARQRRDSLKEQQQHRNRHLKTKRERKIIKRKSKSQIKHHSDDENHVLTSVVTCSHLPQLRQWIENYEEAVTNHYSPELRARISSIRINGQYQDTQQFDTSVHKCRVHTQPLTEIKYLVSTVHLPPNTPVIELRGKYMLSTQHRNIAGNLNTRQHSQRPGPFLFFYRLHKDNTEVCVDTRTYGNSARFVRRSCKPNAELRHCIEKGVLHLYIVTITTVEKNKELTIKHESHDLAAIGTTHILCACDNQDGCTVNKTTQTTGIKKNGDIEVHRKRRGRRTTSMSAMQVEANPSPQLEPHNKKQDLLLSPKCEIKQETSEINQDEIMKQIKEANDDKSEIKIEINQDILINTTDDDDEKVAVEKQSIQTTAITTRRSSNKLAIAISDETNTNQVKDEKKDKNKKLSREERKLEAILKAIAQMEKADQRKQENQAKNHTTRRDSESNLLDNNNEQNKNVELKLKRKRRKGRARTTSTNQQHQRRSNRFSTDSYMTSGDETILSPDCLTSRLNNEQIEHSHQQNRDVGLLLALSNSNSGNFNENDSNSSPETQTGTAGGANGTNLSSACLLVQAAVEPMEVGFKFPKTKKGLMNEWLNKVPEPINTLMQQNEFDNNHFYNATNSNNNHNSKSLAALAQVASFCDSNSLQSHGSAKKRWLRQAISEDHQCLSPESPTITSITSATVTNEAIVTAPLKKRRLPRQSLNDVTPPTTPIPNNLVQFPQVKETDENPTQIMLENTSFISSSQQSNDLIIKVTSSPRPPTPPPPPPPPLPSQLPSSSTVCLMDPRLQRNSHHLFTNSEHLVGTVEKTLSILGFEDREPITPAKRKLSITEYRQRKKLNNSDKSLEELCPDENNSSSESFKPSRTRSNSTSSCTSMTSSDEELIATVVPAPPPPPLELITKATTAFNSEPTELERQREMSNLRFKKAFGIPVDGDLRKSPAVLVEGILNCELPLPLIAKNSSPMDNYNENDNAISSPVNNNDTNIDESSSSSAMLINSKDAADNNEDDDEEIDADVIEEKHLEKDENIALMHTNLFYTIDDEKTNNCIDNKNDVLMNNDKNKVEEDFEQMETVDYVPPFNNPIYPNDDNTFSYASVIDDEGRYEGRNPSPPPDLETETIFSGQNES